MVKTAIVILNWNGLGYLQMFLGNVNKYSVYSDVVICLADNCSTDGSPEWVERNFPDIRIIRFDKNHGYAGGYNLALGQIDAEYYVLLNSDIEVTEGWLQPLVSFLEKNPDVASCQPKILSYTKRDHFEYAGAAGGFLDKYGYPFCRGRVFSTIEKDTGQYDSQIDIFWSSGACMAVRSQAWKKCGGFDESFFAHMEEIDLCWRFSTASYRVCYIPSSVVYHVGGGALPYNSPFKTYLNFRNSLFLLYKNLPAHNFHSRLFIRKLLDGLAALMFLLKGSFSNVKAIWNAHIDFYKSIRVLKEKRLLLNKMGITQIQATLLNKSIVFEFYVKGHKTYDSLRMEK